MKAPVVLIHKGDSSYLFNTLYMLNRYHSKSEIVLIGDDSNTHYSDWCTHFQFDNYSQKAELLRQVYQHKSIFTYEHELFCLQRWAVLESFMVEHLLSKAIYIDSDVLVFDYILNWFPKFESFGMSIVGVSGHTNFVQSVNTLAKFNAYVTDKYSTETGLQEIENWYKLHMAGKADHGISDMDMLTHFAEENPKEVVDLETYYNQFAFDRSISESNGFETELVTGFKKVIWRKHKPFFINLDNKQEIPVIALHLQGDIKEHQKHYIPDTDLDYKLWNVYFSFKYLLNKIERKILEILG